MENFKNRKFENSNIMVYMKTSENGKFEALQSLKEFIIAPNLLYAALIPFEKLEALKAWANQYTDLIKDHGHVLQIRSAKDRKKVLFQIN
jgi:hypothetical protein